MDAGGRKHQPKTTNSQLWRRNGRAREEERGRLCSAGRIKRDWTFCANTRDGSARTDRQTRSWQGILVSRRSRWRGRWNRHRPMRRPFPLILFFSLFLCCGQDRWQARTIFCGPLVLIVQCSYGICIQDKVEF